MRKLIYILSLVFLVSCSSEPEIDVTEDTETSNDEGGYVMFEYGTVDEYHIQEIDGCEYILVNGSDAHEPAFTHKGNCKFCAERNKKVVEESNKSEFY